MFEISNYAVNQLTSILLISVLFITIVLLLTVIRSQDVRYRYFSVYLFLAWAYVACYLMQTMAVGLELKVLWANIKVTSMCFTPLAWLCASSVITIRRLPPKWSIAVILLVTFANLYVVWNDDTLRIFRSGVELVEAEKGLFLMKPYFGFWFNTVYSWSLYLPTLVSALLYFTAFQRAGKAARIQYGMQIGIIIISVFGGFPSRMMFTVVDSYAFTTVFLCIMHFVLIFRYRLMDITPIAKESMLAIIKDGIFIFDRNGKLVEHNHCAYEYTGIPLLNLTFSGLCAEYGFTPAGETFSGKKTIAREYDGGTQWCSTEVRELREACADIYGHLVYIKDITSHYRLMAVEYEKETLEQKKLIIDDIHDGISSNLTVVKLLSDQSGENEEKLKDILSRINALAIETLDEVRLMMSSYDKDHVRFTELSNDLRYIGNLFLRGGDITFTHGDYLAGYEETPVCFKTYVNVIRFYKECIVNSIKHSGCTAINSMLAFDGNSIIISVKDNGKGFGEGNQYGRGLKSMMKRLAKIKGKVTAVSEDGAKLTAEIPMEYTDEREYIQNNYSGRQ